MAVIVFISVITQLVLLLLLLNYYYNIMGDELLLNFWREISAFICNFTCEITKLPWQPTIRLRYKMS